MKKKIVDYSILCMILVGIYLFHHFLDFSKPADYPAGIVYARAKVTEILENEMGKDPDHEDIEIGRQKFRLVITNGQYKGKEIEAYNYVERTLPKKGKIGTRYLVASYDGFVTAMVINYDRTAIIGVFTGLFLFAVIFFGKWKGIKSVFSLGFTLVCVFFLLIPLIVKGVDPIWAAIVVVILSTVVTFYAISGIGKKSILASICCTLCCGIAGLYGYFFGLGTRITTFNTSEAENLLFLTQQTNISIQNMLIAGILIASMGAIMDTSMSMISSLMELEEVNPNIGRKQLIISGFRIGSDIMGTMTNTLILAFAGGSINTLMVYYMYQSPAIVLLNTDLIVIELIRGLAGSLAVVCAIPVSIGLVVLAKDKNFT